MTDSNGTEMTHKDLIEALGGRRTLGDRLGVQYNAVRQWELRNRIPWPYRPSIQKMAAAKGIKVPGDFLNPRAA